MIIQLNNKSVEVLSQATVNDLLKLIGVNRESVLVTINGEIVVEEEKLKEKDVVKLISAVSGG